MVQKRDIPRAFAGSSAGDGAAIRRGISWLSKRSVTHGGQPLLYVPGRRNLDADPTLKRLSEQIKTATWRTLSGAGWTGGSVLAAWPDRRHLAEIDGDRRTSALCVIGWSDGDTVAWLAAFNPKLLASGPAAATAPAISDPVVLEGMRTLTTMVNHANNLAGTMDKRDAIDVLMRLHDAGHRYDPEALYTWSLANGWNASGAERLRDFATRINSGKRLRLGMPGALRSDIVQVWRERATTQPQ